MAAMLNGVLKWRK